MGLAFIILCRAITIIYDRFTIANEMLSLRGSIQPDPFSPAHVPQTTIKAMSEPASESSTAVVRDAMLPFQEEESEGGEDEEIDMFERLGRMGDEAVALQLEAKRRAEEEVAEAAKAKEEKKKKQKRKDSGDEGKVKSKSMSKGERHKRSISKP